MRGIVWPSVASVLFMAGALIAAYSDNLPMAVSGGSGAIATAILALREK